METILLLFVLLTRAVRADYNNTSELSFNYSSSLSLRDDVNVKHDGYTGNDLSNSYRRASDETSEGTEVEDRSCEPFVFRVLEGYAGLRFHNFFAQITQMSRALSMGVLPLLSETKNNTDRLNRNDLAHLENLFKSSAYPIKNVLEYRAVVRVMDGGGLSSANPYIEMSSKDPVNGHVTYVFSTTRCCCQSDTETSNSSSAQKPVLDGCDPVVTKTCPATLCDLSQLVHSAHTTANKEVAQGVSSNTEHHHRPLGDNLNSDLCSSLISPLNAPTSGEWNCSGLQNWRFRCLSERVSGREAVRASNAVYERSLLLTGSAASVGIYIEARLSLKEESLDQCGLSPIEHPVLAHKCGSLAKCQALPTANGLYIGAYICKATGCCKNTSLKGSVETLSGLRSEEDYFKPLEQQTSKYVVCVACTRRCSVKGRASVDIQASGCEPPPPATTMLLIIFLISFTVLTMVGVVVIGALIFKTRKDKIIKAASPSLLYLILTGSLILYSQVVIGSLPANKFTCMALPWLRHVGFAIMYGALLIKTWRISVIMRMFKTKVTHTKDAQLYRAVAATILVSTAYMTVWTLTDPLEPTAIYIKYPKQHQHQQQQQLKEGVTLAPDFVTTSGAMHSGEFVCLLPWWDFIITCAEFCFLIWGGTLCYQSRKAPDMYNESRPISYAIWNEALWCVFHAYSICLLNASPDSLMVFLLYFVRTQCTVTVTLLLLFVPKFITVFSKLRELRGTVTDVYGAKRIHRLSLVLNKNGAIKTVYCVPCGPLTYAEGPEDDGDDDGDESGSEQGDNKENHYTKAEVDNLIEMVSKLKNEKKLYKTQVKRMYHLLQEYKHKIPLNGLPACLVAETPENEEYQIPNGLDSTLHPGTQGTCNPVFQDLTPTSSYPSTHTLTRLCEHADAPNSTSGNQLPRDYMTSHSRKASTITSFLSSTPENLSIDNEITATPDEVLLDQNCKQQLMTSMTSPVSGYSSCAESLPAQSGTPIQDNSTCPNSRANPSNLTLDIPESCRCTPSSKSDSDDDFPRLVQPNAKKAYGDSPQDIQDFISTICGKFGNKQKQKVTNVPERDTHTQSDVDQNGKSHELDFLKNGKTNVSTNKINSSTKLPNKRRHLKKASEKMSFVMYI